MTLNYFGTAALLFKALPAPFSGPNSVNLR